MKLPALVVFAVGLALPAAAQINVLSSDTGKYDDFGFHNPSNENYETGVEFEFTRAFFVFDVPSFSDSLLSASLRIYNPVFGYDSPDASETVTLFSYEGSVASLLDGTADVAGYNDLGEGTVFGSALLTSASDGTWVEFTLTDAFLGAIAPTGGRIVLGASLTSLDPTNVTSNELVFGFSDGAINPAELSLTTGSLTPVPEPSTYALMASALLGTVVVLRRFRRTSTSKAASLRV